MDTLVFFVIGLIAGTMANSFAKGRGWGYWWDLSIGVVSAQFGGRIYDFYNITPFDLIDCILLSLFTSAFVLVFAEVVARPESKLEVTDETQSVVIAKKAV